MGWNCWFWGPAFDQESTLRGESSEEKNRCGIKISRNQRSCAKETGTTAVCHHILACFGVLAKGDNTLYSGVNPPLICPLPLPYVTPGPQGSDLFGPFLFVWNNISDPTKFAHIPYTCMTCTESGTPKSGLYSTLPMETTQLTGSPNPPPPHQDESTG